MFDDNSIKSPLKSGYTYMYAGLNDTFGAKWRHIATEIWVNIGSDNGLLPNGTKPLPEPMLTYLQ